jgi:hypothetical protein
MSRVTIVFAVVFIVVALVFGLIAGALMAQQQAFKERYAKELANRVQDEMRQRRLIDRLAALEAAKQRRLELKQNAVVIAQITADAAQNGARQLAEAREVVGNSVPQLIGVNSELESIVESWESALNSLFQRVQDLEENRNRRIDAQSALSVHLAQIEYAVAEMREKMVMLGTELYHLRRVNDNLQATRQLYLEADPGMLSPGFGGPRRINGTVRAVSGDVVVISLGRDDVFVGMELVIVDNGEFIANIRVTGVDPYSSTATILTPGAAVSPSQRVVASAAAAN